MLSSNHAAGDSVGFRARVVIAYDICGADAAPGQSLYAEEETQKEKGRQALTRRRP